MWDKITYLFPNFNKSMLTHWGQMMHICISKLTIIGWDHGLLPGRRQAIIWTNAGILLIGPLLINFSEILIKIQTFLFKKIHSKILSGKWWLFCLSLNVLIKGAPGEDYLHQKTGTLFIQVMACSLFNTKQLPEQILAYYQLDLREQISLKFHLNFEDFHSWKCISKCHLQNVGHFF